MLLEKLANLISIGDFLLISGTYSKTLIGKKMSIDTHNKITTTRHAGRGKDDVWNMKVI